MSTISPRVAAFSGIAFAVLFAAGLFFTGDIDSSMSDQKTIAWFADSGNQRGVLIGAYCLMVSALCFIPFLVHLRDQLGSHPRSAPFAPVVLAAGMLFAGFAIAGAIAFAWLPAGVVFGGAPDVQSADLARMAPELGFGFLLVAAGLCAFAMLGTASVAALRSHAWATWLAWAGVVVAVLQIADVTFLPYILLLLWVLAASIMMLGRGAEAPVPAAVQQV